MARYFLGCILAIFVGAAVGLVDHLAGSGWAVLAYLVGITSLMILTFRGSSDA